MGRFVSRDTWEGNAGYPITLTRWIYADQNPTRFIDPSGENSIPVDQIMQQVLDWLQSMGYNIVGNPLLKSMNANGADLVAVRYGLLGNYTDVIAVEVKNVANPVTLGTLGKSIGPQLVDYGGSISRVVRGADKFFNSSNEQLKLESQIIKSAYDTGMLRNMLITTSSKVSPQAQSQFNMVYSNLNNGCAETVKEMPPSFWVLLGSALKTLTKFPSFVVPESSLKTPIFPWNQVHVQA